MWETHGAGIDEMGRNNPGSSNKREKLDVGLRPDMKVLIKGMILTSGSR